MAKSPKKIDSTVEGIVEQPTITSDKTHIQVETSTVVTEAAQQPVSGRSVFAVSRVDIGVAVHTAFLAQDGRLLQSPAVFPTLEYGLQQVDEMRQMLINAFAQRQAEQN